MAGDVDGLLTRMDALIVKAGTDNRAARSILGRQALVVEQAWHRGQTSSEFAESLRVNGQMIAKALGAGAVNAGAECTVMSELARTRRADMSWLMAEGPIPRPPRLDTGWLTTGPTPTPWWRRVLAHLRPNRKDRAQ
jgi:hypothetical protein